MDEAVPLTRPVTVSAVVSDPFDGLIRVLSDAQRFGFVLRRVHLDVSTSESSSLAFDLLVPIDMDPELIRSRFARHYAVSRIESSLTDQQHS
jgi:hypothetical protein